MTSFFCCFLFCPHSLLSSFSLVFILPSPHSLPSPSFLSPFSPVLLSLVLLVFWSFLFCPLWVSAFFLSPVLPSFTVFFVLFCPRWYFFVLSFFACFCRLSFWLSSFAVFSFHLFCVCLPLSSYALLSSFILSLFWSVLCSLVLLSLCPLLYFSILMSFFKILSCSSHTHTHSSLFVTCEEETALLHVWNSAERLHPSQCCWDPNPGSSAVMRVKPLRRDAGVHRVSPPLTAPTARPEKDLHQRVINNSEAEKHIRKQLVSNWAPALRHDAVRQQDSSLLTLLQRSAPLLFLLQPGEHLSHEPSAPSILQDLNIHLGVTSLPAFIGNDSSLYRNITEHLQ